MRQPIKCGREGCERKATFSPKVCVPATGYPMNPKSDISLFLGMRLCREHCAEVNAVEIATTPLPGEDESPLQRVVKILTRGKVPPDFRRAYIDAVRIDSEEFRRMELMIAESRAKSEPVNDNGRH